MRVPLPGAPLHRRVEGRAPVGKADMRHLVGGKVEEGGHHRRREVDVEQGVVDHPRSATTGATSFEVRKPLFGSAQTGTPLFCSASR